MFGGKKQEGGGGYEEVGCPWLVGISTCWIMVMVDQLKYLRTRKYFLKTITTLNSI